MVLDIVTRFRGEGLTDIESSCPLCLHTAARFCLYPQNSTWPGTLGSLARLQPPFILAARPAGDEAAFTPENRAVLKNMKNVVAHKLVNSLEARSNHLCQSIQRPIGIRSTVLILNLNVSIFANCPQLVCSGWQRFSAVFNPV